MFLNYDVDIVHDKCWQVEAFSFRQYMSYSRSHCMCCVLSRLAKWVQFIRNRTMDKEFRWICHIHFHKLFKCRVSFDYYCVSMKLTRVPHRRYHHRPRQRCACNMCRAICPFSNVTSVTAKFWVLSHAVRIRLWFSYTLFFSVIKSTTKW